MYSQDLAAEAALDGTRDSDQDEDELRTAETPADLLVDSSGSVRPLLEGHVPPMSVKK